MKTQLNSEFPATVCSLLNSKSDLEFWHTILFFVHLFAGCHLQHQIQILQSKGHTLVSESCVTHSSQTPMLSVSEIYCLLFIESVYSSFVQ